MQRARNYEEGDHLDMALGWCLESFLMKILTHLKLLWRKCVCMCVYIYKYCRECFP